MGDFFRESATSGSLLVALPVALLAGLVSFFSPCVIPLLPGYLSYATGLSGADLADAKRGRMLAGSLLFVAGFTTVFVALGAHACVRLYRHERWTHWVARNGGIGSRAADARGRRLRSHRTSVFLDLAGRCSRACDW